MAMRQAGFTSPGDQGRGEGDGRVCLRAAGDRLGGAGGDVGLPRRLAGRDAEDEEVAGVGPIAVAVGPRFNRRITGRGTAMAQKKTIPMAPKNPKAGRGGAEGSALQVG